MRHRFGAVLVSGFLASALTLPASLAEEPRLYTNDDLQSLEPLMAVSEPVAPFDPQAWEVVNGFLDREYERIAAEREFVLARRQALGDEQQDEYEEITGGILPYDPWWPYQGWVAPLPGPKPPGPSCHARPRGPFLGQRHIPEIPRPVPVPRSAHPTSARLAVPAR